MPLYLDCLSCVVQQAREAVRHAGLEESLQVRVMQRVLHALATMNGPECSSDMIQRAFGVIREVGGVHDPLENVKSYCLDVALRAYPELKHTLDEAERRFDTAVRIAMAGNIIDHHLRVPGRLDNLALFRSIEDALTRPLAVDHVGLLEAAIPKAERILYLSDNAGETVCDRILIEEMPIKRITYAVKSVPVTMDATLRDAAMAGLTDRVKVVEVDTDHPCMDPTRSSGAFPGLFEEADLVIAKGQGNMQVLQGLDKNIFFLARVRCKVKAQAFRVSVGDFLVMSNRVQD